MATPIKKLIEKARAENGKWLATATGGFYFLEGQNPLDITIVDVAIGLARKCRYSGNIRNDRLHYSVAEHSDLMAHMFESDPKQFLGNAPMMLEDYLKMKLHDATEFVFPDVPTPIKDLFPVFRQVEGYHDEKIESAFIPVPGQVAITKAQVKQFDIRIRVDERRYLIQSPAFEAGLKEVGYQPLGVNIQCKEWSDAAWDFIEDFIRAVDTYPARDPQNQAAADKHRAAAVLFLDNNPRPISRNAMMERIAELEAELKTLKNEENDYGLGM